MRFQATVNRYLMIYVLQHGPLCEACCINACLDHRGEKTTVTTDLNDENILVVHLLNYSLYPPGSSFFLKH